MTPRTAFFVASCFSVWLVPDWAVGQNLYFKVNANSLNIRNAPDARAALVDRLRYGETVEVFRRKGAWSLIDHRSAASNWVNSSYLTRRP